MADLYDHIRGRDDAGNEVAKLEVAQFIATAAEVLRGQMLRSEAAATFPFLSGTALTQAATLVEKIDTGALSRAQLLDVLTLAELGRGPKYDTRAKVVARLGL